MSISTTDEDPIAKEELEKKLTSYERATVKGLLQEMDILKQKLDNCYDKLDRLNGIWGTTSEQLKVLQTQYALLANVRVNSGPTVKSD